MANFSSIKTLFGNIMNHKFDTTKQKNPNNFLQNF